MSVSRIVPAPIQGRRPGIVVGFGPSICLCKSVPVHRPADL